MLCVTRGFIKSNKNERWHDLLLSLFDGGPVSIILLYLPFEQNKLITNKLIT